MSRKQFLIMRNRLQQFAGRLRKNQSGFVVTSEAILVATVVVIGFIAGFASMRDALVSELSDVGGAIQELDNSYTLNGVASNVVMIAGSAFVDLRDFCDDAEDPAGAADNCITFDLSPDGEIGSVAPPKAFDVSDVASFSGANSNNNSADGTLGDGTIDTDFTVTTTGQIVGFSGNRVRFREGSDAPGTFQISFDDPLANVEFWVGNFTNTAGNPQNLLGNFTVTLSDGSVLNNAQFDILPDAIAPNSTFGEFTTIGSTRELLTEVVQGGANWVTDPTVNGSGIQAGGRIVFSAVPTVGGEECVGITSIEFQSSGGPPGYSAFFGVSGQVVEIAP